MTITDRMIHSMPTQTPVESSTLAAGIAACFECAQICTACADACLAEGDVAMLRRCIRLNQDCADICTTTGRLLSRQTAFDPILARALIETCATACKQCGDECRQHGEHGMDHCRICAEACQRCYTACIELIEALAV
jgi:hypothetical protein